MGIQALFNLFVSFVLIGAGAYGGGLAAIPLIQHELVEVRQWLEFSEMARILAVAQMTPGPIAINAATFTGFRVSGIAGAATATTAVIFPSMVILLFLAPWVERLRGSRHAQKFRRSVRLGVLSLIVSAIWSYGCAAVEGWVDLAMAAAAFLVLTAFEKKVHPVFVILTCGVIGAVIF